ncbi:hypothetical protein BC829DRAFT_393327 [Chytridium lagenaria]|nr:hypothetical protein BC829DRAFT_393327 [Chytridium lagenaria]
MSFTTSRLPTHATRLRNPFQCINRCMATATEAKTGFRKMDIHLILKKDVKGLGKTGDIVLASSKVARNYLIPFQLAYYVPRSAGKPILPEGWEPPLLKDDSLPDLILPAIFESANDFSRSKKSKSSSKTATAVEIPTASIADIKELRFTRPVIVRGESRIFGSVSADDIIVKLREEFNIVLEKTAIGMPASQKIKELGTHQITVAMGSGKTELDVVVDGE